MRPDVMTLRHFYHTPLGIVAADMLAQAVMRSGWHERQGTNIALGYCEAILDSASMPLCSASFMPAAQGAASDTKNCTALVEEACLPVSDADIDNILVIHALEHCQHPQALMREIWRVLAPGGRVLFVVPNRRRTWASMEFTPFGHGQPFSKRQLTNLLGEHLLSPLSIATALFMPPTRLLGMDKLAKMSEGLALSLFPSAGGLLMVEAEKRVGGAIPTGPSKKKLQIATPWSSG